MVKAIGHALPSGPLAGFITPDGTVPFLAEGLCCRMESEFLSCASPAENVVVLAVGAPKIRARLEQQYLGKGFSFPSLVHPSAIIGPHVEIGEGTIVMAGTVLETHLSIGRHCLLNVLVSVAHECRIGHFCNLGPGVHLPGRVSIGDRSDLGAACTFRPGIDIGSETIVGAGAVVVKNWPGHVTIAGVPAIPIAMDSHD